MKYIKLLEKFLNKTFIDWFKEKSGFNIGKEMGKGNWGVVFEMDKNRCIKISNESIGDIKNLLNKNIPYVVKYYSCGLIHIPKQLFNASEVMVGSFRFYPKYKDPILSYIIMERVIIDKDKALEVYDIMEVQAKSIEDFINEHNLNFTYISFTDLKKADVKTLQDYSNSITATLKQMDNIGEKYNFQQLILMLNILISIKTYVPTYFDFVPAQICFDKDGNIKMVDVLSNNNNINRKEIKSVIK